MSQLQWLDEFNLEFPDTNDALDDPNGLLAIGGDLRPARLLAAYRRGIFPWYSEGQPILWWTPDPRLVIVPEELHIGRTTRKLINKKRFAIRVNTAFDEVIDQCASIDRDGESGTWITDEIIEAYQHLHTLGYAQSVEAWQDGTLVGGLYGINLGRAFFGESMFSHCSGASRVAFAVLAQQLKRWQYSLIDCQIKTDYLSSFGGKEITRKEFEQRLDEAIPAQSDAVNWADQWDMPVFGID